MENYTKYKLKAAEELAGVLAGTDKIFVLACNKCFKEFETLDEPDCEAFVNLAAEQGKTVTGSARIDFLCNKTQTDKKLIDLIPEGTESIFVVSCGLGVQTIAEISEVPVYAACNSLNYTGHHGMALTKKACDACAQCYLTMTGGICPIVDCSKSLVNGQCGGAKNGKCEVSPDKDCAWEKIQQRLAAQGRLSELTSAPVQFRDYSKVNFKVINDYVKAIREKRFDGWYGGVHPVEGKERTESLPLVRFPEPKVAVFPLSMHLGAPATACVEVGDYVKVGQKVGEQAGFISAPIHSSISGKVIAIEERPHASRGKCLAVVVENDFKNELHESVKPNKSLEELTPADERELAVELPRREELLAPVELQKLLDSLASAQEVLHSLHKNQSWEIWDYASEERLTLKNGPRTFDMDAPDRTALELLRDTCAAFGQVQPWMKCAAVDGREDGPYRRRWETLVEQIRSTCARSAAVTEERFGHDMETGGGTYETMTAPLEKLRDIFAEKKKVSKLTLMFHKDCEKVMQTVRYDGHPLASAEECAAVLHLLELEEARRVCGRYWEELLVPHGVMAFRELDLREPERTALNWTGVIERCLNWYRDAYTPLRERLSAAQIPEQAVFQITELDSRLTATEAIWNLSATPAFCTISFKTNSAIGLRQIFPWHTNKILVIENPRFRPTLYHALQHIATCRGELCSPAGRDTRPLRPICLCR